MDEQAIVVPDDSHGHWIGQEAYDSVDLSLALGLQEKLVLLLQTILSHSHGTQVLGQLCQYCMHGVGRIQTQTIQR